MTVPQRRNQKKTKHRKQNINPENSKRIPLDDNSIENRTLSFEDWLGEIRRPGEWLEKEYLEQPTMGERLLALRQTSFLDRPRSFLDSDDDYNPDFGNDFDDFIDFEAEY